MSKEMLSTSKEIPKHKNALEEKFISCQISSKAGNTAFKKDELEVWISSTFPVELDLQF